MNFEPVIPAPEHISPSDFDGGFKTIPASLPVAPQADPFAAEPANEKSIWDD